MWQVTPTGGGSVETLPALVLLLRLQTGIVCQTVHPLQMKGLGLRLTLRISHNQWVPLVTEDCRNTEPPDKPE